MPHSLMAKVLVVGGVALDITSTVSKTAGSLSALLHTSSPGRLRQTLGGVGRNVCEAAMRTGAPALLVSAVGDDLAGQTVRQAMKEIAMPSQYIQTLPDHPTAVYNAIHSKSGQLIAAVADMDIFDAVDPLQIDALLRSERPAIVCMDGNLAARAMARITATGAELGFPVFFEPTSVPKSLKIFEDPSIVRSGAIQFVSPNEYELEAMSEAARARYGTGAGRSPGLGGQAPALAHRVLPYALQLSHVIPNVVTKLGEDGCLYTGRSTRSGEAFAYYFEPEPATHVVSVTGAGDCFVGTLLANLRTRLPIQPDNPQLWTRLIRSAQQSAVLALQSTLAVSPRIDQQLLCRG